MVPEDEIRIIAHRSWEEEGRPEGRDLEHWLKAESIWRGMGIKVSSEAEPEPESRPGRTKNRTASRNR